MTRRLRVPAILIALSLVALAGCSNGKEAVGGESLSPAASSATPAASAPAPVKLETTAAQPAPVPVQEKPTAPALAPAGAKRTTTTLAAGERLKFSEFYKGASITEGLVLSDKVKALNGKQVTMAGYMAPPLKASMDFFVLTKVPMAICPFCSTDADWPDDIVLVLVDGPLEALPYTEPIEVTGPFEVGGKTDEQSGFYSLLRIKAESVKAVK